MSHLQHFNWDEMDDSVADTEDIVEAVDKGEDKDIIITDTITLVFQNISSFHGFRIEYIELEYIEFDKKTFLQKGF